jgi:hypothetical protein
VFFVPVNFAIHAPRARLVVLLGLLACVPAGIALFCPAPKPAPVVVLQKPYSLPLRLRDRIGAWIPRRPGWTWAFRLEDLLFGRRSVVNLFTEFLKLPDKYPNGTDLGLGLPQYSDAKGLQIWLLGTNELKSFKHLLQRNETEMLNSPRITTADGISASLFAGESISINGVTNQVGVEAAYFARVSSDKTDLFADLRMTGVLTNNLGPPERWAPVMTIQTNLDVAVRLQIPKGMGVFIIGAPVGDAKKESFGVIIDPP